MVIFFFRHMWWWKVHWVWIRWKGQLKLSAGDTCFPLWNAGCLTKVCICDFSWGYICQCLLIPVRAVMIDLKKIYSHPAWWASEFTGVPYGSLDVPQVATSANFISPWMMGYGSCIRESQCTMCRQLHWRGSLLPRTRLGSHNLGSGERSYESHSFLSYLNFLGFVRFLSLMSSSSLYSRGCFNLE